MKTKHTKQSRMIDEKFNELLKLLSDVDEQVFYSIEGTDESITFTEDELENIRRSVRAGINNINYLMKEELEYING